MGNEIRSMKIGEWGFILADLETKTVHVSNTQRPNFARAGSGLSKSFDGFLTLALELFEDDELLKVVQEGVLIYSGHFDGTF